MPTFAERSSAALSAKEPYAPNASAELSAKGNPGEYASARLPANPAYSASAALAERLPSYAEWDSAQLSGEGIPEAQLLRMRQAYLINPPISEAEMISTTPVTKTIVAATKGKYATSVRAATSSDSDLAFGLFTIGPTSMTELQLEVNNWWFLANTTEEQINSGTLSVEGVLIDTLSGTQVRWKFGGSNTGTVPTTAGAARLLSDVMSPASFGLVVFPAFSRWLVGLRRTAASSSDSLPYDGSNQLLTRPLEADYWYPSSASSAATIAAAYFDAKPPLAAVTNASTKSTGTVIAAPNTSSGSGTSGAAGGLVLLGRANGPTRAVCVVGHSIADGNADVNNPMPTDYGDGWAGRMLVGTDGLPIASLVKATVGGDRAQYRAAANTLSRNAMAQCTTVIIDLIVNDLANGRTFAQLTADIYTLTALAKSQGAKYVLVAGCCPRTASTDSWATLTNQSFGSPSGTWADPAGTNIRGLVNAQFAADAAAKANNIDGYIDFPSVTESGSTGKWRVDLGQPTTDGIHPQPVLLDLMGAVARTAVLALPTATV